jgi:predicted permease
MNSFTQDLGFSVRKLIANPGFTFTALLSLALGIGATTAVFSVIYAVLVNPFPFRNAEGILRLTATSKVNPTFEIRLTPPQIQQLRRLNIVESVLAMDYRPMTITGQELPENVHALGLISSGFQDLGVPAAMGRGLQPSDAVDGQEPLPVALVSYQFWQERLGSDPQAVGKTLQLDRKPYTVVGVAGPRFRWYSADVYLPLKMDADPKHECVVNIRLRPGVSLGTANVAIQSLVQEFAKLSPKQFPEAFQMKVEDLNAWVYRSLSGTLYLLLGAVALLLLIGCGNVAILLMAQGAAREHEFAVRGALGASSARLLRQLLSEALLLGALGVIFGAIASYWILAGMKTVLPKYAFAPEVVISINLPVLLFSVCVALFSVLLFGLWPAMQQSQTELGQAMAANSRRSAGSVRSRRTHSALILLQVALTMVLLAGAGSVMKSFLNLLQTPLGYDPTHVMSVGIPLREKTRTTWASRAVYFEQLRAKVAETPGVSMAAISMNATPPRNGLNVPFEILGKSSPADSQQMASVNLVSSDYFATLRIPLLAGRLWSHGETQNALPVAVINRTLAERYFPNASALGQSLHVPFFDVPAPGAVTPEKRGASWLQVIGVVEDAKNDGLSRPVRPSIFVPFSHYMWGGTQILVRTEVAPLTLLRAVRLQLTKVDADQQTNHLVRDLESWVQDEPKWQQRKLTAWIFGVFSGLALALSAVGLFSVVSYTVAQRIGEFGIRMSLGAQRMDITKIVLRSITTAVGGGIALGVALSFGLNTFLLQWMDSNARDPLVLLAGVLLLGVAAILASAIPAWRASSVDPVRALSSQ